jgi:uncharacterized membrane protein YccC
MSSLRVSLQASRFFEHFLLRTDVARALRSSVAMVAAWVACLLTGHAAVAVLVATAAQNVAMPDLRGDYRGRFVIMLALTVLISISVLTGIVAGHGVLAATLAIGVLSLFAGCWRHLSGDYGPNFALTSALLFFIALSQPGDWRQAVWLTGWTSLGCLGGIFVQLSGWLVRPQHPLRHAVAESWVGASDLIAAMRTETNDGQLRPQNFAEKEGALRATVDRTLRVLEAASGRRSHGFVAHLDATTHLAARLATRTTAFYTALDSLKSCSGFAPVSPILDSVLRSLANMARSTALTLIRHRPEQLLALQVRLRRSTDLIRVLDGRLAMLNPAEVEVVQCRQLLTQVGELLPGIRATLAETVDHGSTNSGFALRLPELGGLSLRSLGAWINPPTQLDSVLIRYTLRVAVLLMMSVAAYKWFNIPHGYWIAFTVLVVLQPDYGATRQKAGQRLVGTLAGSAFGSLLLWMKMPMGLLVFFAAAMAFGFAYFFRRRYGLAVFFVTVMIVLMTEAMTPVDLSFTVARLLSTLAGGILALLAAFLLWPKWEQQQFPRIIATALRANRKYMETVAAHFIRGESFTGDAVRTKREAERANSQAVASLQRLLSEPSWRQNNFEQAAALTTYNQRLTRTVTVLGQHLDKRERVTQPGFAMVVAEIGETIESLAARLEASQPTAMILWPNVGMPSDASANESLVYRQLTKIVTEIEAMTIGAGTATSQAPSSSVGTCRE